MNSSSPKVRKTSKKDELFRILKKNVKKIQ